MNESNISNITVGDFATNCWLYPLAEGGCAVIDPGDEAERIIALLKQLRLVPTYILLTHGHFDHIAALPALAAACGDQKPVIAIHSGDREYLGDGAYQEHRLSFSADDGDTSYLDALWKEMPPPDRILAEGDTIGPFTVLHLPGHTPGSSGFWDQKAKILFSGDTLFQGDYGRTDLPGGSEAQIFESLKRLISLDSAIRVLPGHGPETTIGAEAGILSA